MPGKKILLIDGTNLVYRAFFALPRTLSTSKGILTNAVYGFTSMILKILADIKPDGIAVAFDMAGPTFRHQDFEQYKAQRPEMPDELIGQLSKVREIVESLNIPIYEKEGFEADDVLGTIAKKAEEEGHEVIIATGDRDVFQLISPLIKMMAPQKGISDITLYDRDKMMARYNIPPEKVPDFIGLKGDTSDNIPGVPGIGEKTALDLIKKFGSLESVLDNVDKIPGKLGEILKENKEQAIMSKELATIVLNVPLEFNLDEIETGKWDPEKVSEVFEKYEFRTLLSRFTEIDKRAKLVEEKIPVSVTETKIASDKRNILKLIEEIEKVPEISLQIITNQMKTRATSISICTGKNYAYYIPLEERNKEFPRAERINSLKPFLESKMPAKIMHNAKEAMLVLNKEGIKFEGLVFDTMIAGYLIEPSSPEPPLEILAQKYLEKKITSKKEEELFFSEDESEVVKRTSAEAEAIFHLKSILGNLLEAKRLKQLFDEVEIPLVSVLARMEINGVAIDTGYLKKLSSEMKKKLSLLEQEILQQAGMEFNINSPQQLGNVLFDKLKLPVIKKTKTGYSTDAEVLSELLNVHSIISKIIEYRELTKLLTTYIDILPQLINPKTGRVHTSFHQALTATGRLSSSNPNLQNIPIRTETGQKIRHAFITSSPDDELLVADYSQIELRILAHFSEDEKLIQAFEHEIDIHTDTACRVFNVSEEEMSPDLRRKAKAINFGIIYGMGPFGLAKELGISKEDAKLYISSYFKEYPGVKAFRDKIIAEAREEEFVETIMHRRRYTPELTSDNYREQAFGERIAINTVIQGSAADLIKMAMIELDKKILEENIPARMILQVHDELIFEVAKNILEKIKTMVREIMENIYPLKVHLKIDIGTGKNWSLAK